MEILLQVCKCSSIKRFLEIQIVVAFKVEKHISLIFFFLQEILSVAKKSKVENQVCCQHVVIGCVLNPKGARTFYT